MVRMSNSWVRLPAGAPSGNNSGQVVNTHVPLSPSSTIWYRPKGSDALWPGTPQSITALWPVQNWPWRRTGHAAQTLVVYPPTGSRPR